MNQKLKIRRKQVQIIKYIRFLNYKSFFTKYTYIYNKNYEISQCVDMTQWSNSPLELLDGHGDLEVVSQDMQGGEDVSPLDHLSQRTPLQHLGAENVPGLFRQEAHMDQDLEEETTEGSIKIQRCCLRHFAEFPWLISTVQSRQRSGESHVIDCRNPRWCHWR